MRVSILKFGPKAEQLGFCLHAALEPDEQYGPTVAVRPDNDVDTGDLFSLTVHEGSHGIPRCQVFVTDDPGRTPHGVNGPLAFPPADGTAWRQPLLKQSNPIFLGTTASTQCPRLHEKFKAACVAGTADAARDFLLWSLTAVSWPRDMVHALTGFLNDLK